MAAGASPRPFGMEGQFLIGLPIKLVLARFRFADAGPIPITISPPLPPRRTKAISSSFR